MTSETTQSVSIVMTGSGGAGVMTAGSMLLDAAGRAGYYALMTRSSGPQIRGGEAAAMVRIATHPVESHTDRYDMLVAIDWQNVDRFAAEIPMDEASLMVGDPKGGELPKKIVVTGARQAELPMKALAKEIEGGRPNMLILGAVASMIGLPEQVVTEVIERNLARKGQAAVDASIACVRAGAQAAAELPPVPQLAPASADSTRWSITGNQAAGLGAVRGGVRFVAAYPITPGTEVLEWLAPALKKVGGVLVQAEDELASVTQIIGGSYGGTPSLTATSGPGLALMMESIGLAVASETPIVIVDVMRGGPSTGIPTKSEQSDLNIAVYGLHGDAPHIVVAPTSLGDCLFTTQWAVHLAESLQTAAIVLSDQSLGQSQAIIDRPADVAFLAKRETPAEIGEDFKRYAITASGVSPMPIPGMTGGQYTADGLEHTESGTPSSSDTDHSAQMDKRLRKLTSFNYGDHWADIDGDGETAILTWGSTSGPVTEALNRVRADGGNARLIKIRLLLPVQPERFAAALEGVKRVLIIEQTHGQQFYRYLRAHYELPDDVQVFAKPGPLPIRPAEVVERLANWS
ncbi:MAG: 2-oxoglutarate synthase [Gammaproteobacteria bacterium]|nr:MAG: 2-oxoglutarate synthase [Gammaproteobacteria bacterium]